ncbi:MAG: sugar ABC transporter ATP-binding protein [Gammaproteobacteria bacterium]|nr:sugar ABC transporter ATP-binding protein [Gammaproteobacteria bacterium]
MHSEGSSAPSRSSGTRGDSARGSAPYFTGRGLTKSYGPIDALRQVDIDLYRGEVHALVGENGAGKSTLKKVLSGEVALNDGTLAVDGRKVRLSSPMDARRFGIAVVHQHFPMAEARSVAENIFLGELPRCGPSWLPLVDHAAMWREAKAALAAFSLSHLAGRTIRQLSVAERQVVAIASATRRDAEVIILDEPTSSLNASEVETLFATMRKLRDDGACVVFISHSMEEVLAIADRITVLRDGKRIGTIGANDADASTLVRMIVGRDLAKGYPKSNVSIGKSRLTVSDIDTGTGQSLSLAAKTGECVGLPAHLGSGVDELLKRLSGQVRSPAGRIELDGVDLSRAKLPKRIKAGLCLVPGDAASEGLVPLLSIEENILLPNSRQYTEFGIVRRRKVRALCRDLIKMLDIRPADPRAAVNNLSGGNRQKVVIAKWLAAGTRLLIMDDPTKGVDVGAKIEIYSVINATLETGSSVVLASTDLDELIGLSDRILVIRDGAIVGEHARQRFDKVTILEQLIGAA